MNKKMALVPKLRFPEFQGKEDWKKEKIGNYLKESKIIGSKGDTAKKLTVKLWGKGVCEKKETIRGSNNTQYYRRKSGQFIYSKLDFLNQAFGIIPNYLNNYESTVDLPCFDVDEQLNAKFLLEYVQRENFYKIYGEIADGGRKAKRIQVETFLAFPVYMPKLQEQQKIADCLSSLDDLITAEDKKLEALKSHKKGLLQKLFPAEGKALPEWRFPEFRDSREWDLIPTGEKVDLISGYAFKSEEISQDESGTPLMRGINITEGFIRHNQDIDRFFSGAIKELEKYQLQTNDLVIGMDGSKVGKNSSLITQYDDGALLVQRVARLRAESTTTIEFIFHHINSNKFHSYVEKINTSSGIPHISAQQIKNFKICFPPDIKEQQKIAQFLSSIDELIAAQSEKIEALKTHKKGLMQGLFPSIKEVGK